MKIFQDFFPRVSSSISHVMLNLYDGPGFFSDLIWVGIKVSESNTRINTCSQTPSSVGLTYTREFGKCIELIAIFDGSGEPFSIFVNRDCNDRLMSVCERFF